MSKYTENTGPNGQILPELKQAFPDITVIRRPGIIHTSKFRRWHYLALAVLKS